MPFKSAFSTLLLLASLTHQAYAATAVASSQQQELAAGSAMLVDLNTNEVLYSSNINHQVPIASVTKLMTAMVVLDAKLPLDEMITVDIHQAPIMRNVYSRVRVGSEVSRETMMLMTLMSSENRAATALAHHYPGGYFAFIDAMNAKATALGMEQTRYAEPTGLSADNVSSAKDLVILLQESQKYPLLGKLSSTEKKHIIFNKPRYNLDFQNTNKLVFKDGWNIALTKTGYTSKAGHCLIMLTEMNKRKVAFVVLDTFGKYTHIADASRLKKWLETGKVTPIPASAKAYKQQKQLAKSNS
ncbi:D-alanyl-D-alanine endopeptidase [Shewanella glacialimarina]|uniref:D-alanyl-D-alanine endopeptidase n=1 Tax=Shewanella glacialimarina TaxID=2590884 RepID=UPI001CF8C9F6|nr:D-alanyl-D-alanine endopeptidase [Shewanella glacialimarina]UCX06559.1 D-alanyl-D-alanine endopeptidase [Shewanella glacialimarina]